MFKKVSIIVFVILFLISCGLGYWSYTIYDQVKTLDTKAQDFKSATANQFTAAQESIAGVDSKIADFETETTNQFSSVQSNIGSLDSDLTAFITVTAGKFGVAQDNIDSLQTGLSTFGTQLSESAINVRRVYEDTVKSVCFITDGTGSGSGFIYSADGYVITNWHVINNMTNIDVMLHDGSTVRATLVGSDKYSDVAVLKINTGSDLIPLKLADSSTVVRGEPVMVVGNPYTIFETVTYGIISRTKGMIPTNIGPWEISNLIQFDAAINHGNSGGPVINAEGQVIGIASYSYTSGEGIHYAVSSNKIARVARAIIDDGSFTNATLPGNWRMFDLTPEVTLKRGLDNSFGVIFTLAQSVGQVQVDDIVTAVDGVAVTETADLFSYIAEFKSVGDTIILTVIKKDGTQTEEPVTLVEGWVFS